MYTFLILLVTVFGCSQAISYQALIQEQWEQFKLEHFKIYGSEYDEQYRRNIYLENLHKINEHNKLYEMGLKTYKMAMNHFGDLSEDEFLRHYTVSMPELPQMENLTTPESWLELPRSMQDFVIYAPPSNINKADLPQDIDWYEKGAVTAVKNQGNCGSCWSFSATGALEGQWFRTKQNLIELSEQNLVDCSWKYGNHGCNGGWMHWAFNYIKENGGIDTESSYPYTATDGQCHYNSGSSGATVSQVVRIPQSEEELEAKVATVGPISIAAEVSHNFGFYHSGVYDEPNCGQSLNHAMLVTGYGNLDGQDYWMVKNSWGTGWGDKGYIRMSRNKNNQCGIALAASYPVV